MLLVGCSDSGINIEVQGSTLVQPGNQVILVASSDEVTTPVWTLSDQNMGVLTVSEADPYQATFMANPNTEGQVTVSVSDQVSSTSVDLVIADLVVVGEPAWNFARQGGGEVQSPSDRGYGMNTVISHWNFSGHWLEWDLAIPEAGEYTMVIRYATKREPHQTKRELKVNGVTAISTMNFNNTGGYAGALENSTRAEVSEWGLAVFPGISLDAGSQSIRLTHTGDEPTASNGTNVAYIAFIKPDLPEITDELLQVIEQEIGIEREMRHWY